MRIYFQQIGLTQIERRCEKWALYLLTSMPFHIFIKHVISKKRFFSQNMKHKVIKFKNYRVVLIQYSFNTHAWV